MVNVIDNGGAIAIKGFNYQKASILLVIVHNFEKDDFLVIPESQEDFEVHLQQKKYFIQVKGTKKISIDKLKSRPSGKASIIEKNLSPGADMDLRKIFVWDLTEATKNEMISKVSALVPEVLSLSPGQKKKITEALDLSETHQERMDKLSLYITPFSNNLSLALTVLKGEMVNKNLLVTNDRANVVLGELALEIDQKSEITVTNASDIKRKEISGEYLKRIFNTVKQKELFYEVLSNLSINTLMKNKVKKEKIQIPLLHQTTKEQLKQKVDISLLFNGTDDEAIEYLRGILVSINPEIKNELSIALAIDCFCELGE